MKVAALAGAEAVTPCRDPRGKREEHDDLFSGLDEILRLELEPVQRVAPALRPGQDPVVPFRTA